MTRKEMLIELEKRYGRGKLYVKHFSDAPAADIYFHSDTGFSVGIVRDDTREACITDSGELQQSYRIDGGNNV